MKAEERSRPYLTEMFYYAPPVLDEPYANLEAFYNSVSAEIKCEDCCVALNELDSKLWVMKADAAAGVEYWKLSSNEKIKFDAARKKN